MGKSIKLLCKNWAKYTFESLLKENYYNGDFNSRDYTKYRKVLKSLELLEKKVDGFSSENLPRTQEQRVGGVSFTGVFHSVLKKNNFSLVSYICALIDASEAQDKGKIEGIVARGIRTFTSFIREPQFASGLKKYLKPYHKIANKFSIKLGPKQDAGDHTDVRLVFNNKIYLFWLYQFSKAGLPHDMERVSGMRREIPDGNHVLCPLPTEYASDYIKIKSQLSTLKEKIKTNKKKLRNLSPRAVKGRANLNSQIDKQENDLKLKTLTYNQVKLICDNKIEIVEGWFLYSQKYIEEIAKTVKLKSISYDKYSIIQKRLLFPAQYLGQL
jgi:hypothetical protein